jgi:hypothetical protein
LPPPPHNILSSALGVGAALFGLAALVGPGSFGRVFGIRSSSDPTVAMAIRSIGARDLAVGLGMLRAVRDADHDRLRDWLLARTLCDAGDALAVSLAVVGGERSPRLLALGGLALGAAGLGAALAQQATRPVRAGRRPV